MYPVPKDFEAVPGKFDVERKFAELLANQLDVDMIVSVSNLPNVHDPVVLNSYLTNYLKNQCMTSYFNWRWIDSESRIEPFTLYRISIGDYYPQVDWDGIMQDLTRYALVHRDVLITSLLDAYDKLTKWAVRPAYFTMPDRRWDRLLRGMAESYSQLDGNVFGIKFVGYETRPKMYSSDTDGRFALLANLTPNDTEEMAYNRPEFFDLVLYNLFDKGK